MATAFSLAPPTAKEIHQADVERRRHSIEMQRESLRKAPGGEKQGRSAWRMPHDGYSAHDGVMTDGYSHSSEESDFSGDEIENYTDGPSQSQSVTENQGSRKGNLAQEMRNQRNAPRPGKVSTPPVGQRNNANNPRVNKQVPSHDYWKDNDGSHVHATLNIGRQNKTLVLCFDGTGNRFKGNGGDTNILKIFSMLDRRGANGAKQYHYYQPGIGTYLTTAAMEHKTAQGVYDRVSHYYHKAMDAAVGTSFDQHVIGGYSFLMRYYHPGDDIYMFGFSRGAYTARFLAEMLDHVGLVVQGNEEMVHFAWKTFSHWQQRQNEHTKRGKRKKEEMYNYMKAFRETFTRPVKRVRFLGLFDTVNSVRRFENAWLRRGGRFPYTARSTARIIRHAVGIDERRAKFRLDLVEKVDLDKLTDTLKKKRPRLRSWAAEKNSGIKGEPKGQARVLSGKFEKDNKNNESSEADGNFSQKNVSLVSLNIFLDREEGDDDDTEQDVLEVWFPGCHGDIGGGWDLALDEHALSYGPLVWMIREARKAGLKFNEKRLREMGCLTDLDTDGDNQTDKNARTHAEFMLPTIQLRKPPSAASKSIGDQRESKLDSSQQDVEIIINGNNPSSVDSRVVASSPTTVDIPVTPADSQSEVDRTTAQKLLDSFTKSRIHDCLVFNNGISHIGVVGWKIMEYLPFRRMDLQPDGSWKAIWWPLPMGEVRDIPDDALIHVSALKRMQEDENYRPGNLIIGGGGRGLRRAPKDAGIGEWIVHQDEGSLVGEVYIKKKAKQENKKAKQDDKHTKEDNSEDIKKVNDGESSGNGAKKQN